MSTQPPADPAGHCVEHGIWTPVPATTIARPATLAGFTLPLAAVDPAEHDRIAGAGVQTMHLVGCTGDFSDHAPQAQVAAAMVAQLDGPPAGGPAPPGPAGRASFLFHLGDVVYKDENKQDPQGDEQPQMYNAQFYAPYTAYRRNIFAIAGNHDGKVSPHPDKSAVDHFVANFCAPQRRKAADNQTDDRPAMTQPYLYWRLDTPLAYIIGLYANIANGGMLDDPATPDQAPQYDWLVAQLQDVGRANAHNTPRKAVLLAVHFPPYSGATNFAQRGDPTLGPTNAGGARPLGVVLQAAFAAAGQRPDVVLSAHAHLYQRLTYTYAQVDGPPWEVPYVVAGSGGHSPVEPLWRQCDDTPVPPRPLPFAAVPPRGLTLPPGQNVQVVAYNDQAFGFLRLTIAAAPPRLTGEFFTVGAGGTTLADSFQLDLQTHQVTSPAP